MAISYIVLVGPDTLLWWLHGPFVFPYATSFRTFSDIFHFLEGAGGETFASFELRIMQSPPCRRAHDRIHQTNCEILGRRALTNDPGESVLVDVCVWFARGSCRKLHPIVCLLFFSVVVPDTPAVLPPVYKSDVLC